MKRKGLYLGKFMPIHTGHTFVIETAVQLVDELIVLVCSAPHEPIAGKLRAEWVKQTVPEGVVVRELHKDLPQLPEDDDNFWTIWQQEIAQFGTFDCVFGGEEYVVKLGEVINAKPYPIGRDTLLLSATDVRNNLHKHWNDIPNAVKNHYRKTITLLGPESVGKSVLSKILATRYDPHGRFNSLMPEYGRTYECLLKKGKPWDRNDFVQLLDTHVAMREALRPNAGTLLIEDTDAIQTMAWEQALLGTVNASDYAHYQHSDFYILLYPSVAWVDDGTRYGNEFRLEMYQFLQDQLDKYGLSYVVINSSVWQEREQQAFDAIEQFFPNVTDISYLQ